MLDDITGVQLYYRYEAVSYSVIVDAERELYDSTPTKLVLREYSVAKKTAKGVWLTYGRSPQLVALAKHFVLNTSRKKFAYPTREEALAGFIARKQRQIRLLKAQLDTAEEALWLAEVAQKGLSVEQGSEQGNEQPAPLLLA